MAELQRSPTSKHFAEFSYQTNKQKGFTARIHRNDSGFSSIELTRNHGYNHRYLKTALQANFDEVLAAIIPPPGTGDSILTRHMVGSPPSPGATVTLPAGVTYYAVNGGIITCNGDYLPTAVQAVYVGSQTATCSGGGSIMAYTEFKIL